MGWKRYAKPINLKTQAVVLPPIEGVDVTKWPDFLRETLYVLWVRANG
jgi:hypothetical protein